MTVEVAACWHPGFSILKRDSTEALKVSDTSGNVTEAKGLANVQWVFLSECQRLQAPGRTADVGAWLWQFAGVWFGHASVITMGADSGLQVMLPELRARSRCLYLGS